MSMQQQLLNMNTLNLPTISIRINMEASHCSSEFINFVVILYVTDLFSLISFDVIANSLVLYLQFCSTLNKNVFFFFVINL